MANGTVSPKQVKDVLRTEEDLSEFVGFLKHRDQAIRAYAAVIVSRWDPKCVVDAILEEEERFVIGKMLHELGEVGYNGVEDLTQLLRGEDSMVAEQTFRTMVKVGRADLLFTLAVGGDDKTTERVRRYLNEQGWL